MIGVYIVKKNSEEKQIHNLSQKLEIQAQSRTCKSLQIMEKIKTLS